ncbi:MULTISPECIES: phage tail fiber protein, partial [unclassified Providencia]
TDKNTTKDAQGNLRAASPIVKVFADHIETNDESEGVTLEKLGVGRYKLKGVLGMNSDASWGGYNGGIVIPKGINGLELVWADYKVLADGDIILETHYRKHADLPPPVVLNRLIAYPEFMDENGNELESYTPCDIPNGHWIDIRVQMPNDSIYNQKQTEAQRLAKLEAERLAQEEAKRAAEEAERTEQEADI